MVARWAATISNGFALHHHSVVQHCLLADESIRHKYSYLTVLIKLIHLDFLFRCLFNECPGCYGFFTPHMLVIFLLSLVPIGHLLHSFHLPIPFFYTSLLSPPYFDAPCTYVTVAISRITFLQLSPSCSYNSSCPTHPAYAAEQATIFFVTAHD